MNRRHIVVFSGGSAANSLVDVFGKVAEDKACSLSYIIPISDNGGSSSELIRVFGGPGIGDIRSRLVRLIPPSSTPEQTAIKTLFNHRLSSDPLLARIEWLDIVEARHALWTSISPAPLQLIRSFLLTLQLEITKRARPTSTFNFQSAALGNLFLTGARLFTGSFESAIYLLSSITGVPSNVKVIPAINSNFSHHISAGLEDGTIITGQNSISHPSAPSAPPTSTLLSSSSLSDVEKAENPVINVTKHDDEAVETVSPTTLTRRFSLELSAHDKVEDANLPGSLPTLRKQYIEFAKEHTEELHSRISRIWYINPYGQEIRPSPNTAVLEALNSASSVIYSIGSLYTSIIPCLILRDIPTALSSPLIKTKILLLNGSLDRETRSAGHEFTAVDFVQAIGNALGLPPGSAVTHLIHLHGPSTPYVDKTALSALGIESVKLYGRKKDGEGGGMIYDATALCGALEAIVGSARREGGRSRRNTVENGGYVAK